MSKEPSILQEFSTVKYKSFSGDVSGVIGEALFSLILRKKFGLGDDHFAHFGASKSTGIFPDFGIHAVSEQLRQAFAKHGIMEANLTETRLIPAEVKAMANPNLKTVKERLDKATQQIRNFWATRKLKFSTGQPMERGASIIFMVLRNPSRLAYDGVIIWMS